MLLQLLKKKEIPLLVRTEVAGRSNSEKIAAFKKKKNAHIGWLRCSRLVQNREMMLLQLLKRKKCPC